MQDAVREIAIEDRVLANCDVSWLTSLFFTEMTIANAKILAGSVVLTFPKYDNDSRPTCTIPEIRAYISKLHGTDPRFPFYYHDEGEFGAHLSHLACLSPLEDIIISKDGSRFQLRMENPDLVDQYLDGIAGFMQQLEYGQREIEARIQSVMLGLGII